jgi:hypothetical protein
MKKLEHGMLLDAKKVEDLGLYYYFARFAKVYTDIEADKIYIEFVEALVGCDVSADYEKKESTWGQK